MTEHVIGMPRQRHNFVRQFVTLASLKVPSGENQVVKVRAFYFSNAHKLCRRNQLVNLRGFFSCQINFGKLNGLLLFALALIKIKTSGFMFFFTNSINLDDCKWCIAFFLNILIEPPNNIVRE